MAKSSEYPDLTWVTPRAYGKGRDGKAVRFIVIHYTAGSERNTSAEDGAAYDARRTDGTSTHYFADSNSVVQCVKTFDRANAARARGNRLGIQYELCGTQQTRAQWLDTASRATLQNAAEQVARDCKKYGIPVRRLTVAETRKSWTEYPNGPKGIVGHVDCTNAFPEDGGDHQDPGTAFPWDVFLGMVRDELQPPTKAEDDVTPQDKKDIIDGVIAKLKDAPTGSDVYPGRDLEALAGDLHAFLDDFAGDGKGAAVRLAKPGSLGALLRELVSADVPARLAAIEEALKSDEQPIS